jgi:transcriptional regulator with XRE-family HTH domain
MADSGGVWERNFRSRMAAMRESLGWTQTDLAKTLREDHELPFHQATIARIEAGDRPVRLDEAHIIAGVFGVDLTVMTAGFGSDDVLLADLQIARDAYRQRLRTISDFLNANFDLLQPAHDRLQVAWENYCAAQLDAGKEPDSTLRVAMNYDNRKFERVFQAWGGMALPVVQAD